MGGSRWPEASSALVDRFQRSVERALLTVAPADVADRLCELAVQVLPVDGAALSVLFDPTMSVPVGLSDDDGADAAERLQFSLGEGPCWEAFATRRVVVADLLDESDPQWRHWPVYTQQVLERTRYRAVASAPFVVGASVGALTLYAGVPWRQGWPRAREDAASLAATVARALGRSEGAAPAAADQVGGHSWMDSGPAVARGRVWLAESLVMDTTGAGHDAALDALRAYAFVAGLDVDDVADALVHDRLDVDDVVRALPRR